MRLARFIGRKSGEKGVRIQFYDMKSKESTSLTVKDADVYELKKEVEFYLKTLEESKNKNIVIMTKR